MARNRHTVYTPRYSVNKMFDRDRIHHVCRMSDVRLLLDRLQSYSSLDDDFAYHLDAWLRGMRIIDNDTVAIPVGYVRNLERLAREFSGRFLGDSCALERAMELEPIRVVTGPELRLLLLAAVLRSTDFCGDANG